MKMNRIVQFIGAFFLFLFSIATAIFVAISALVFLVKKGPKAFAPKKRTTPPACLYDREFGERSNLTLKSGININYVAKGDRENPLLLLIHGFPEFWYSWRYQLKQLSDTYYVVAVDNRGYGRSSKPKGIENYKIERLTEDVREIVDALGYKKCFLAGHDWGGMISWFTAFTYPEIVEKLIVLNAPHSEGANRYYLKHPMQALNAWYVAYFQLPYIPEYFARKGDFVVLEQSLRGEKTGIYNKHRFTEEDMEAYKYTFNEPGAFTCPMNYYRAIIRHPPKEPLNRIRVPTLVIWGLRDSILNAAMVCEFSKYTPDMQVRFIPTASHFVQQDEPELCSQYIREFLR